ncbi:MAG: hypothetical protein ABW076_15795 [Candidatus Thiodiazotropha sp.]
MSNGKVPVTFLNAHSGRKGALGVLAFPDMLTRDDIFCRFFTCIEGNWGKADFEFDGKALTYKTGPGEYRGWWILGKNGEVAEVSAQGIEQEQIPGAGLNLEQPYGYVEMIRNIAGELYVCGYGRQVYKRSEDGWASISDVILTRDSATGFFDIDGSDPRHIYAVGWQGEIYFYDGSRWHQDDSPTNSHLASVCCAEDGSIWIAGNKGVVLHGQYNQWTQISSEDMTGNWYSVAVYEGKAYLAGNQSLAVVEGDEIVPLDVGLDRAITTHKLSAREGLLWSVGEKDILMFDGQRWQEVAHPDNV